MRVCSVLVLGILTLGAVVLSESDTPALAAGQPVHATANQSTGTTCGPPPPSYASAVKVSTVGKVRWSTALPTNGQNSNEEAVVVGRIAFFGHDGTVSAIDTSSGRSIWSWTGGQTGPGMWAWNGLLAVLTDQVSDHAQLTGLDEQTGAVRWQLAIPGTGLIGNPRATGDGGLAWLRADGVVQVINLANGHVRWSVLEDTLSVPIAIDGLVLAGHNGVLHAFADQTGRRRWATAKLPVNQFDQVIAGRVIVSSEFVGPSYPTAITAIDPATGRIMWQFDPGIAVTVLSAGPAGLAVATYVFLRRLYLLDFHTGKVLWQANTAVALDTLPIVLSHDIVNVEGGVVGYPGIRLVDRNAATGQVRWKVPLSGYPGAGFQPVLRSGSVDEVETSSATGQASLFGYGMNSGKLAWRAAMPEDVPVPPVLVRGAFYVEAATPGFACAV